MCAPQRRESKANRREDYLTSVIVEFPHKGWVPCKGSRSCWTPHAQVIITFPLSVSASVTMKQRQIDILRAYRPSPRSVAFQRLHKPPLPRNVGTPDSADTPAPGAHSRLSSLAQCRGFIPLHSCICCYSGIACEESFFVPDPSRNVAPRMCKPVRITTCLQLCRRDWKAWVAIVLLHACSCRPKNGYERTCWRLCKHRHPHFTL